MNLANIFVEGPRLEIFGVLVAVGVALGYWFTLYRTQQAGLDKKEMESAIMWALIPGFIGAHVFEVIFYTPGKIQEEGLITFLKIWDGISSYGGFLGGVLGLVGFYVIKRKTFWREGDVLIQGLIVGWIFGRLGCTVVGDHPGTLTDFFLAYPYAEGARHNLGLYEFLYALIVLFPANWILHRQCPPVGSFIALNCLLYAPCRFALDFMRATDLPESDLRHFGLTFAQYASILAFLFGIWLLLRARKGIMDPPKGEKSEIRNQKSDEV